MSQDELANGQRWVGDTVARLLAERGLKLDAPIRWTPDIDHEIYVMEARMGGNTKSWKLTYEAVEDCVADKNVQREIEKSLRMYFIPDSQGHAGDKPTEIRAPAMTVLAVSRTGSGGKRWDVFISHASEDKEEIARPLAEALKQRRYEVWYDAFALKLGDSLRESINRGLAESRYGVVILSKHFFAKHWPTQELNGLTAIEVGGEKVILPIWHGVTQAEVVAFSPILADRKAVSTQEGLERVVAAIEEVVNPPISEHLGEKLKNAEEKLKNAEERLQEYCCPYCGSPLSEWTSVPLSEHDEGLLEGFECGYSHIDGHKQQPCPSDPKFPKLEDYDFQFREIVGDSMWKWECFASGRTKEAKLLSLARGLGRTREEARQRLVDSYKEYAKPWKG